MPRPWSVSHLFAAMLVTFVVSTGIILSGFAVYVILQSNKLHEETRETVFESIQSELEAHYQPLRTLLRDYRREFRDAHIKALEHLAGTAPADLEVSTLQQWMNTRVRVPVDVYLVDPEGRVINTTYPPDEGLNFHHPALLDGRTMIERSHRQATVVTGPPVLEVVARELRIYTYSPFGGMGHTLEFGFVPRDLNERFRAIEARLNNRESFNARLHFVMWDDWVLSLKPDRSLGAEKHARLDQLYREKVTLLGPLQEARDQKRPVRRSDTESPTYFVHLMDMGDEGMLAMNVLAEVTLENDPVGSTRTALLVATVTTLALLLLLVLLMFRLIRQTLTRPLTDAARAMENREPLQFKGKDRKVRELQLLASHYNALLDRTQLQLQGLNQRARTDSLTQLANRYQLESELDIELRRSDRYREPLSLIFMDVDHFKRVNDDYGHLEGDRLLRELAALLTDKTREADTVGRWGGEEFLIICRHTSQADAIQLAEALREAVSRMPGNNGTDCTASFGVTAFVAGDDLASIMARADHALYSAKRGGRNRVESAW